MIIAIDIDIDIDAISILNKRSTVDLLRRQTLALLLILACLIEMNFQFVRWVSRMLKGTAYLLGQLYCSGFKQGSRVSIKNRLSEVKRIRGLYLASRWSN
jgi:hypothetical protein